MLKNIIAIAVLAAVSAPVAAQSVGGNTAANASEGFTLREGGSLRGGCSSVIAGFGDTGCQAGNATQAISSNVVQGNGDAASGDFTQRTTEGQYFGGAGGFWDNGNGTVINGGNVRQGAEQGNFFSGHRFAGQGSFASQTDTATENTVAVESLGSGTGGGQTGTAASEGFTNNEGGLNSAGCGSVATGFGANTGCAASTSSQFQRRTLVEATGEVEAGNFSQTAQEGSYSNGAGYVASAPGDVYGGGNVSQGSEQRGTFGGYRVAGQGTFANQSEEIGSSFVNVTSSGNTAAQTAPAPAPAPVPAPMAMGGGD